MTRSNVHVLSLGGADPRAPDPKLASLACTLPVVRTEQKNGLEVLSEM